MLAKIGFLLTVSLLCSATTQAGEERRIVGYANGQPLYLNGAAPIRRVNVALAAPSYRLAPVIHVGSTGCYHGTPAYGGNSGYTSGYDSYSNGYGSGYGYGYNPPVAGFYPSYGGYGSCRPYAQPYPAASSRGYAWIPRYGSTSAISRYPH